LRYYFISPADHQNTFPHDSVKGTCNTRTTHRQKQYPWETCFNKRMTVLLTSDKVLHLQLQTLTRVLQNQVSPTALRFPTNAFVGLHLAGNDLSPGVSIHRKPLPPDSPYSPPNSPRTSMIVPQTPILTRTTPPKPHFVTSAREDYSTIPPETAFVHDESLKTVSLTSSSNHDLQQPPPSRTPVDTSYPRCTYRALHPIPEVPESGYERMRFSEDDFPMRPKTVRKYRMHGKVGKWKGWIIVMLTVLTIVIVLAVLAAVAFSNYMRSKDAIQD
jgi:hypothetical protein